MLKNIICFVLLAGLISVTGCQNTKTRAVEGALIGGLVGAAAGGIIGHQSGHGGEGAGIGAAAGVLTGAVIGSQVNKPDQQQQASAGSQASSPNQMSLQQIAQMAQQKVNDDVIIDRIKLSNSRYNLNQGDIDYLKQNGVSQKVIDAMQITGVPAGNTQGAAQ